MGRVVRAGRVLGVLALVGSVLALSAGVAMAKKRARPPIPIPAGLSEVNVKGFQRSFVRMEADLATPRAVCVSTGEFTLDSDWPKKPYGRSLRQADLDRIKDNFQRAVRSEFEKAFRDQGGYTLAADTERCALRVVVSITDLYLNAPEAFSHIGDKTYARSIGHMGLKIDVLDPSGSILLAQAHAKRVDPDRTWSGDPYEILDERNRITEIDNVDFARDTARDFAEFTRTRLLKPYPRG